MITLGIDLSSQPTTTAASHITWSSGHAIAAQPRLGCTDDVLEEMIAQADVVGIDAPFGWPAEFVSPVAMSTAVQNRGNRG